MALYTQIPNVFPLTLDDINNYFSDKENRLQDFCSHNLNRTLTMFKYNNLPKEIKEKDIETIRQCVGYGLYTYKDGKTYALTGSFAPPVNYLNQNTGLIVVNPWIEGFDGTYKIVNLTEATKGLDNYTKDKEGVLFRNDPLCRGLYPIFIKYGILSLENDITFRLADINLRQFIIMTAKNENVKESAELFLEQIENGKQGIITDNGFNEDEFKGNPITIPTTFMSQLIESSQYIKASMLNEIGLNANYNMKREKLSQGETEMNVDMLRPLPDVMLEERKEDAKAYTDFTGGEVKWDVEFDSVWAKYNLPYSQAVENNSNLTDTDASNNEDEEISIEEKTDASMGENEAFSGNVEETTEDEISEEKNNDSETEKVIEEVAEIVEDITDAVLTLSEADTDASNNEDEDLSTEEKTDASTGENEAKNDKDKEEDKEDEDNN